MLIMCNGESLEISDGATVSQLLTQLDLKQKRFAVEINSQLVPKGMHEKTLLNAEDKIEIVQAIGGG